VAETYLPVEEQALYVGEGRDDEFHLTFDFELLHSPWECRHLALAIERAEARLPADIMPTYQISNHDQSRHATRWGERRTRAAAFLLLMLRDVAVLYAGEEIGMVDADEAHAPDRAIDRFGRDPARTPMQWDATPTGGFTSGEPWLPLVDPATRNVAAQAADPASLLVLYRRLIAARRASAALRVGAHRSLFDVAPDVLAWVREAPGERILVLLNAGDEARRCNLGRMPERHGVVLVGTGDREGEVELEGLVLQPLEGIALRL